MMFVVFLLLMSFHACAPLHNHTKVEAIAYRRLTPPNESPLIFVDDACLSKAKETIEWRKLVSLKDNKNADAIVAEIRHLSASKHGPSPKFECEYVIALGGEIEDGEMTRCTFASARQTDILSRQHKLPMDGSLIMANCKGSRNISASSVDSQYSFRQIHIERHRHLLQLHKVIDDQTSLKEPIDGIHSAQQFAGAGLAVIAIVFGLVIYAKTRTENRLDIYDPPNAIHIGTNYSIPTLSATNLSQKMIEERSWSLRQWWV
eukprot:TRINITY_DN8277_c0_g1_i1.p1 TRINITY_DN8277_c0_g1~~TRINITY_DN8277_c0_g1_i1.p1  ORF type:complete len:261 (+),score=39.84 TRINITY_DN8277_c0_g1_i1:62-844(+)